MIEKLLEQLRQQKEAKIIELAKKKDGFIEEGTKELDKLIRQFESMKKIKEKKVKTKKDVLKLFNNLCWKNISYCCSSPSNNGKQCAMRDGVLDALGLNEMDFENYKKDCNKLFRKILEKKKIV